jgi:hypothetical protein
MPGDIGHYSHLSKSCVPRRIPATSPSSFAAWQLVSYDIQRDFTGYRCFSASYHGYGFRLESCLAPLSRTRPSCNSMPHESIHVSTSIVDSLLRHHIWLYAAPQVSSSLGYF